MNGSEILKRWGIGLKELNGLNMSNELNGLSQSKWTAAAGIGAPHVTM
jgi:hypothetical protein